MDQTTQFNLLGLLIAAAIAIVPIAVAIGWEIYKKKHKVSEEGDESMGNNTSTADHGSTAARDIVTGGSAFFNSEVHYHDAINQRPTEGESEVIGDLAEIKLAPVYSSLFAEDNQLKTERITISNQDHGKIEGKVELIESDAQGHSKRTLTYNLTGVFSNRVLTGEYISKEDRIDERGAINLRLIDGDLLSGFCSFSKLTPNPEDEIRVSPYIWVAGENIDLLNGTYNFCTECYKLGKVCCCASEDIDMPLFLQSEVNAIRSQTGKHEQKQKNFSTTLEAPYETSTIRRMRRDQVNGKTVNSKCHFFDLDSKQCKIYGVRPLDCRLFPFDIRLSSDKTEYKIGYYSELCEQPLPDPKTMKRNAHILRPYFFLLYPYLHIFTSDIACQKLKDAEFTEIGNFKDFVF